MDISKRYSIELNKISNHLADLEQGHTYELTKTSGTPSCATLAQHLKEDIVALLNLIQNDKQVYPKKKCFAFYLCQILASNSDGVNAITLLCEKSRTFLVII